MTEYDCTISLFLLFSIRSMANKKNLGTFFKPLRRLLLLLLLVLLLLLLLLLLLQLLKLLLKQQLSLG